MFTLDRVSLTSVGVGLLLVGCASPVGETADVEEATGQATAAITDEATEDASQAAFVGADEIAPSDLEMQEGVAMPEHAVPGPDQATPPDPTGETPADADDEKVIFVRRGIGFGGLYGGPYGYGYAPGGYGYGYAPGGYGYGYAPGVYGYGYAPGIYGGYGYGRGYGYGLYRSTGFARTCGIYGCVGQVW